MGLRPREKSCKRKIDRPLHRHGTSPKMLMTMMMTMTGTTAKMLTRRKINQHNRLQRPDKRLHRPGNYM